MLSAPWFALSEVVRWPGSQLCGRWQLHGVILDAWQLLAPDFGLGLFRDIWIWFMLSLVPVLWIAQSCITAYGTMTRTGSIRINCKILLKCIDCWLKQTISSGNTVVWKHLKIMLQGRLKVCIMIARVLLKYLSAAILKFIKNLIWFLWYSKSPVTNLTITCFLMSSLNMTDLANTLAHKSTLCW